MSGTATVDPPVTDPAAGGGGGSATVDPTPAGGGGSAGGTVDPALRDAWEPERAMQTIHTLRGEVKSLKQQAAEAAELKRRVDELEAANLTEQEKIQRERDQLLVEQDTWQRERRETELRLGVYSRRDELGIADADLALAALDRSQVEFDDQGRPSNLDTLLTELLETKPILKGQAASGTPAPPNVNGGSGGTGGTPPALTAEELATAERLGMTPERYALAKASQGKSIADYARERQQAASAAQQ